MKPVTTSASFLCLGETTYFQCERSRNYKTERLIRRRWDFCARCRYAGKTFETFLPPSNSMVRSDSLLKNWLPPISSRDTWTSLLNASKPCIGSWSMLRTLYPIYKLCSDSMFWCRRCFMAWLSTILCPNVFRWFGGGDFLSIFLVWTIALKTIMLYQYPLDK